MPEKIYLKTSYDTWGIKFYFDDQDMHYTLRFAGNPILILEEMYNYLGWPGTFGKGDYDKDLAKEAIEYTETFLTLMRDISARWMSPLVVYKNKRKPLSLKKE